MVHRLWVALLGSCLAFSFAATAQAQPAPAATVKVADNPTLGKFLTDDKDMSLYMYTRDTANTSNCYDRCATNWPPLLQAAGQPVAPAGLTGTLGTTTRRDNTQQVTYNGMPLYYYAQDTKVGDTTGQNVSSVWFVVAPGSTFASFPAAPPAAPAAAPAPATPAAAPAPAAPAAAAPVAQPAQLPRTGGDLPFGPLVAGFGLALLGLGVGLRRRQAGAARR